MCHDRELLWVKAMSSWWKARMENVEACLHSQSLEWAPIPMFCIPSSGRRSLSTLACVPSFADVLSVEMKDSSSLEFSLKTEQLILHSPKAPCIKTMVELFMQELRQVRQQLE